MSDFKAKMYQIQFPQTPLGSLQCSPGPLAGLRGLLLRGGGREGEVRERKGEGKGRGREGKGRDGKERGA